MYLVAIGKAKHIYTCRERGERHAIVASLGALHARTSRIDDIDMSVLTKSATDNRHQLIGSVYGHARSAIGYYIIDRCYGRILLHQVDIFSLRPAVRRPA